MSDLGEAARAYARAGWRVFPVRPLAKVPMVAGGVLAATTDLATIDEWWRNTPDANIGLALDRTRCVVDVDVKSCDGFESLDEDLALILEVGATPIARTPSGGAHLYLRADNVPNTVGALGPGLDTRGDRGYVLAPPSRLPGGEYSWQVPLLETPCAVWDLPDGVASRSVPVLAGDDPLPGVDVKEDVERARAWLDSSFAERCKEGGGANNTAFRVAARVREFGLSEAATLDLLVESRWNAEAVAADGVTPYPWDREELGRVVRNVFTYAQNKGAFRSVSAAFADVPPPPSGNPLLDAMLSGAAITRGVREPEWLVKGVIPTQGVGAIAGREKVGKTFVALDLACHLALGRPWQGRETKRTKVLYIAAEYGDGLRRRALAWGIAHKQGMPEDLHLIPRNVRLHDDGDFKALLGVIEALPEKPGLIVIDTLTRSMAGLDVTKASDATVFTERMDRLARATGGVVLGVGHTSKGNTAAVSLLGSVVFQANIDFLLFVERPDEASPGYLEARLGLSRDADCGTVLAWEGREVGIPGWSAPGYAMVATARRQKVADKEEAMGGAIVAAAIEVLEKNPGVEISRDALAFAVSVSRSVDQAVAKRYIVPSVPALGRLVVVEKSTPRATIYCRRLE